MHPRFCTYVGVKDVSQHLRLCIFRCVASAAHFFIFRRYKEMAMPNNCPKCSKVLTIPEKVTRQCFHCGYTFPVEKKKFPIFPLLSLLLTTVACALFIAVLSNLKAGVYWVYLSYLAASAPIMSKYFRQKLSQSGRWIELIAMTLNSINISCFIFFLSGADATKALIYMIGVWVLYARLFNNIY